MSEPVHMPEHIAKIAQHLDSVLDVLSDGIFISDRNGNTLTVNKMYERLTGIKQSEVLGRNVAELRKSGVFDIVLNPQVVSTKKPATSVQQVRSGKKVVLRGYPVLDDDGEVSLVVTFARDITMITQMRDQIAQQRQLIEKYHDQLKYITHEQVKYEGHVFSSKKMQDAITLLKRVADTDATVLLLGETGVGKDVFARMTHEHSPRKGKNFLKVDCGSISENLIESELFGYSPGAFSGASTKGKTGYFEMADKGTLFLDEIGELPLTMQAKLLRVLQDQEVMRVGSSKVRKVDVRIIAATNRNLEEEVAKGNFRSDLFYRLRVAVLDIPPLRERQADIIPLAKHFTKVFGAKYKKPASCSEETLELFKGYRWPGNVREMQNLVQSLVVTSEDGLVTPADLPVSISGEKAPAQAYTLPSPDASKSLKEIMAEIECDILEKAIEQHGSVTKVAKMFKVNRTTIFRKLNRTP